MSTYDVDMKKTLDPVVDIGMAHRRRMKSIPIFTTGLDKQQVVVYTVLRFQHLSITNDTRANARRKRAMTIRQRFVLLFAVIIIIVAVGLVIYGLVTHLDIPTAEAVASINAATVALIVTVAILPAAFASILLAAFGTPDTVVFTFLSAVLAALAGVPAGLAVVAVLAGLDAAAFAILAGILGATATVMAFIFVD